MGSSVILPPTGQPPEGADPGFRVGSVPNIVSFAFDNVAPPSPVYIQRDDILGFNLSTSQAGEAMLVAVRLLLPYAPIAGQPDAGVDTVAELQQNKRGTIVTIETAFQSTNAIRNADTFTLALSEGYLLSVAAKSQQASTRGQSVVSCAINRGTLGLTSILSSAAVLFSDYAYQGHPVGWPGGRQNSSVEGPGWLRSVNQANPAAGADFIVTVPAKTRWRLSNLNAQLAVANAGAARTIMFQIKDAAGNLVWQAPPNQTAAINTTVQFSVGQSQVTSVTDTTTISNTMPGLEFLPAGFTLQPLTRGIQAADQWSAIWFEVEEWIDQI